MSKMGDWVLEMQEDCVYMDRGSWAEKHGSSYLYIFDEFLGIVPNKQTIGEQHGESRTVSECRSTDR